MLDKASSNLTRTFTVDQYGNSQHVGPQAEFYRDVFPDGFVDLADVLLDSQSVFTLVEEEARRARVGFDSLSYLLKARELTNEPIWVIELREEDARLVGSVTVSALSGKVLRSVWFNWKPKPAGGVETAIHDSLIDATEGRVGAATGVTTTPLQTSPSTPGTPALRYGGAATMLPAQAAPPQTAVRQPSATVPVGPPANTVPTLRTAPSAPGVPTRIPPPPIPTASLPQNLQSPYQPGEVDTSIPPPPPTP